MNLTVPFTVPLRKSEASQALLKVEETNTHNNEI